MKTKSSLLALSFTPSAAQQEILDSFSYVAPIFLKDKGVCLVVLPPDAKEGFDQWIAANRDTEDYDGFATLTSGFFGIRLKDDPEIIQAILSEIGVTETGRYIIAHRPARKGQQITYSTLAL